MKALLSLLGAAAAALAAYLLAEALPAGPSAARRLEAFAGGRETLSDRIGRILARWAARAGLDLEAWALRLRWAALEDPSVPPSPARLLGQGALYAAPALMAALILSAPVFYAAPALLFVFPFCEFGEGERRPAQVRREIPEVATLIAAELAAGAAPDRALERAAARPGPLARILAEALEEARKTGRPLFSRGPARGVLVEFLRRMGEDALSTFAVQLDMVAEKGAAGAELMASVAESLAREEQARAMRAAERLESDLVIPAALFFFLPFVAVVMLPILASLFRAF